MSSYPKIEPDFIQRLVSRALDEDSAIEPRLPSLFEPASASWVDTDWQDMSAQVADEAAEGDAGDNRLETGRHRGEVAPVPTGGDDNLPQTTSPRDVALTAAAPAPELRPIAPGDVDGEAHPSATVTPPHQLVAAARARAAPNVRSMQAKSAKRPAPNLPDVPIRGLRPLVGEERAVARRPSTADPDQPVAAPSLTARRSSFADMDDPANFPVSTGRGGARGALVPSSTAAAQRIAVALPGVPYRPGRNEALIEHADDSAAPTVNVTIGRVEVRALPAATTVKPRNERRGPQPMTLDDYLKQRRGDR